MMLLRFALILVVCALAISPLAAKDDIYIVPSHHIGFPDTDVGAETTLTIQVMNRDIDEPATLTGVTADGAGSQHFIIGTLPTAPIEPNGGVTTFTATFRPLAPGEFDVEYYLNFEVDGRPGKRSFHLQGKTKAPRPDLYVLPDILNFGTVTTATFFTGNVVIRNRGNAPGVFLGVDFPPGNDVFTFEAPPQLPVQIPENSEIRVVFGFRPLKEGKYQTGALLRVGGPGPGIGIRIRGELAFGEPSPQPRVEVFPVELNFGTVTTASVVTKLITVSNTTGTADATVTGIQIAEPVFALGQWGGPVVVTAGTQVQLPIAFHPQAEKSYATLATVQTTDGAFSVWLLGALKAPDVVEPFLTASVSVPNITANVGDEFALPFIIDDISNDAAARVASCRAVLRFNSTLMTPRTTPAGADSVSEGMRTVSLDGIVISPAVGGVLFSEPMVAALGDAEATPIDLLHIDWFDSDGGLLNVATNVTGGQLTIGDIWRYGGVRLVNSNAGALAMEILPNPVSFGKVTFRMSYQAPSTLVVYDVMGNSVLALTDVLPAPGLNPVTLQADTAQLPVGTYYCRLSSGKFSLVRTMRIE